MHMEHLFCQARVDPSYSLLIQRNKDIIRVHISRSSQDELPGRVVAKVFYPTVFSTDEEFDSNLLDGKTNEQLQRRVIGHEQEPYEQAQ